MTGAAVLWRHVPLLTSLLMRGAVQASRLSQVLLFLAMGTLRLGQLRESIRRAWDGYAPAATEVDGLFPVERELFERHITAHSQVLVVGSGGGRDLLGLAELDYRVTGVEPAPGPISDCERLLRKRGVTATVVHGFFEEADLPASFDAITFSYFTYGLTPVSGRRVAMLRKAAALLNPGGRIFLTYDVTERPHRLLTQAGRLAGILTGSDWRIEPGDRVWVMATSNRRHLSFIHIFT